MALNFRLLDSWKGRWRFILFDVYFFFLSFLILYFAHSVKKSWVTQTIFLDRKFFFFLGLWFVEFFWAVVLNLRCSTLFIYLFTSKRSLKMHIPCDRVKNINRANIHAVIIFLSPLDINNLICHERKFCSSLKMTIFITIIPSIISYSFSKIFFRRILLFEWLDDTSHGSWIYRRWTTKSIPLKIVGNVEEKYFFS